MTQPGVTAAVAPVSETSTGTALPSGILVSPQMSLTAICSIAFMENMDVTDLSTETLLAQVLR